MARPTPHRTGSLTYPTPCPLSTRSRTRSTTTRMSTTRTPAKRAKLPRPGCPRLAPADAANQPTQKMTQPTPITMSTTRIEVPLCVRIAARVRVNLAVCPPAGQPGRAAALAAQIGPRGRVRGDDERPRLYGGPMASVKQVQVTFDCAEPERVARFWCEVLGYVVPPPPQGFATWDDFDRALPPEDQGSAFACVDPSGAGPRLFFQRVPEVKVVKNRLHLDVRVGTGLVGEERVAALEAECARLVALGAVRVRLLVADGENESCLVMQDIEGNEFDLD